MAPKPLSPETKAIVKACVPALEAKGVDITQEMYKRLLANPEIRDLFNMSHQKDGEQQRALAFSVLAYAKHIDNPAPLGPMIERIAEKHVGLNILPEHYPYVGKALLEAIAHVLGDAATPEIMAAWTEAYWFLADVLIGREHQIYEDHAHQPGGWVGWRRFRVAERRPEAEDIVSFKLVPADGKEVMLHKPGQYLSFRLDVPEHGSQRRNYSISSAPSHDHYRLTIKRQPEGVVSNWFYDNVREGQELDVSAPAGDFQLPAEPQKPVVFLSGGVGVTPMISMIETLAENANAPKMHYVHSTHSPKTEAFGDLIRKLTAEKKMTADLFFSRDKAGAPATTPGMAVHEGRIPFEWVTTNLDRTADYYICGPVDFLVLMVQTLKEAGLPTEQIHYEMFGSASNPYLALDADA
ncbi:NO-inducible flavohemoprotein [Oecophyllibacter saccharovorans]|uniref:Flavohemoprotein n=1 Tax=Oecophyllibacter saccharovorans TaxID=2558360 RepID=A0A506UQG8_9PROT|nr:NO-inducible flavohemoprotein [Oecophyllibacter saccharovorans]QDH15758.1 NO-inducible flavohemoprotein [Oecophyllibacter saccharovorans]TPW35539.1 NO-inducible flavohemoprotein [Oecophyllibacter saccharovorans]